TGIEAWASCVDEKAKDVVGEYRYLFPDLELRAVRLPKGDRIVAVAKFDDVQTQNNNGAELLAAIMALRIEQSHPDGLVFKTIKSDSRLIVDRWSEEGASLKSTKNMDPRKVALILELKEL